jgi:hypothetical protein
VCKACATKTICAAVIAALPRVLTTIVLEYLHSLLAIGAWLERRSDHQVFEVMNMGPLQYVVSCAESRLIVDFYEVHSDNALKWRMVM